MRTASAPGARGRQRLSPEDEVNLLLDSGDNVYVVTIVGSFAPGGFVDNHGGIDLDLLRAGIAERIARVPRLRQRLEFDSGKWWLSQADADLTHHVREIAPAADRAAFEQRCADLSAMRLPLDRPLWELLAMPSPDGLAPASWIFRVHHVVADGVTAASLLGALFDADVGEQSARPAPDPRTSGPPRPDPPAPPTLRHWHRAALRVAIRIQSAAGLTRALLRRMPPTVLLGPLGFGRGLRAFDVSLDTARAAARAGGGTINDVLLVAAASGAEAARAAGGDPPLAALPVSVPVIVPGPAGSSNQVSATIVRVPIDGRPASERVRAIAPGTRRAVAGTRGRPLPWFVRARAGGRLMRWFLARQRAVGLALSNVRGPATAQRLCGAPVTAAWALPVLSGQSRIGIAAVSYAGRLTVCVLWSDTVGSAGPAFARGMREALEAAVAPG